MSRAAVGCIGKKRYERFADAEFAAKRMRQNLDEAHLAAYHCRHCGGTHIGENKSHGRRRPKEESPP
jgi:hypothetical protein